MHTLSERKKLGKGTSQWDVIFVTENEVFTLKEALDFETASRWVNYLNGGIGHVFSYEPKIVVFDGDKI